MKHTYQYFLTLIVALLLSCIELHAGQVPVHDPSICIVYKDANNRSYPEQSAQGDRTKYYYVVGTQLGAAYSRDMLDWTAFSPTFIVNGKVTTDYSAVFGENATWSGWQGNNAKLKENLWAADIIWNRDMKKWCLYYSVNGDDWHSSICMLASENIEGPYERVGSVVFGGMDGATSGAGNNDFKRVTGQNSIPSRYYNSDGGWGGNYGSSCIDPNVLYDENGELWMNYGSWSGGIFLIKLDNRTGLRDYNYNYGYTNLNNGQVMQGSRLRYDEYMGIHIAGGYYVSGEGPYIEYMKDANGEGYYYLFMSYGFYSPEGGYNMRLFRSKTLQGPYLDPTNDDAVFHKAIYPNYGTNVTYGISLMQNYSWNWWTSNKNITEYDQVGGGQTAQGHNSALMDEDGKLYIIYHTKDNTGNGYGWHHVESHPMVFASDGWPLVAPFESRLGEYTDKDTIYKHWDIMGQYQVLTHNAVNYEKLVCNKTQTMQLNADKSISGAYIGTWDYDYAGGKQYITLKTSVGTFNGTLIEQRMEDDSRKTLCLTAMNPTNELCLWAYREPQTKNGTETIFEPFFRVGTKDQTLLWDETSKFLKTEVKDGDFEVSFSFHNNNKTENNWDNWSLWFDAGNDNKWSLRADAYSLNTFEGATVTYAIPPTWDEFDDKDIVVKVIRQGTSIHISATADDKEVYGVLCKNAPKTALTIYLGGESTYLDVKSMSSASLNNREGIGKVTNYGTYKDKFKAYNGAEKTFKGDFNTRYSFNHYHSVGEKTNWNNFIVRNTADGKTGYIRADKYQFDSAGEISFESSWGDDWNTFLSMLENAKVDINITRNGNTITYDFAFKSINGLSGSMKAVQKGISNENVSIALTEEASFVDVLSIMNQEVVECEIEEDKTAINNINIDANTCGATISNSILTAKFKQNNAHAILYSANGTEVARKTITNNTASFNLSSASEGVYMVVCGKETYKVIYK